MSCCVFNIPAIEEALFDHRRKIWPRYGDGKPMPTDPPIFAQALVDALAQPLHVTDGSPSATFRAAALSIASNMRFWRNLDQAGLADVLGDFTPEVAKDADVDDIAQFLPGQTRGGDARGIIAWANLLCDQPNYYNDEIVRVANAFGNAATPNLPPAQVFLTVAAYFSAADGSCPAVERPPLVRKWPQMGFALGSEFLRNLGWNGFKPDTHIIRLLAPRWQLACADVESEMLYLEELLGRRGRTPTPYMPRSRSQPSLRCQLLVGLTGVAMTPHDDYSRMDNLLWLLASEVESSCDGLPMRYLSCS